MIEKVNPHHPDKVADRIAGALVDYAYTKQPNPKVAFEVLIGHGKLLVIGETSVDIENDVLKDIVKRITNQSFDIEYRQVNQDIELAKNQIGEVRTGDNGIFKGVPVSKEVKELSDIAREIYSQYPTDGKYILDGGRLIICQSNATTDELKEHYGGRYDVTINPLGDWVGGTDVDTGAVNRKLGSDMGEAVTGGGLHGKDLTKADVSVNIYAHLQAQRTGKTMSISCAIGDKTVDGLPYSEITAIAGRYIKQLGGFEKLAEWGLV